MKKYIKIFSLALCVLFCLSILLSAGYVVHSSNHVCMGKDCHICGTSTSLKKLLSSVSMYLSNGMLVLCLILMTVAANTSFGKAKRSVSLIEDKVKLTA